MLRALGQQAIEENLVKPLRRKDGLGNALGRILIEIDVRRAIGQVEIGQDRLGREQVGDAEGAIMGDRRGPDPALGANEGDGAAKRLGVGYDVISARNPRIIYGYGPGYRQDGPNRDYPAYDDVVQGESGIASLMAQVNGSGPRFYPTVIIDKLCGYVLASAIGMALYERERSGLGQDVHVPMFETILAFNYMEHLWGGAFDPPLAPGIGYVRLLTRHRKPYPTLDGHICVLAVNDDQWRRILPALDRPDLVNDPRFATTDERVRNYDELYAIVALRQRVFGPGPGRRVQQRHRPDEKTDHPGRPLEPLVHDFVLQTWSLSTQVRPESGRDAFSRD